MKKMFAIILFSTAILLAGCGNIERNRTNNENSPEKNIIHASLAYAHYGSINDLADKASDIVMGKIVNIRVELIDARRKVDTDNKFLNPGGKEDEAYIPDICTVFTLKVDNVYKGNHGVGDYIEIKQLGGETDDVIYSTDAQLDLGYSNNYVFFLESYDNLPADILNPIQGAYIFNNKARGVSDSLVSVSSDNDLELTYSDLNDIATQNSSSTQGK